MTILSGLNFSAPTLSNSTGTINAVGTGAIAGGLFFSYPLFQEALDLEAGALLSQQKYETSQSNISSDRLERAWQFPFVIRLKLDALVGIGAGVYYGLNLFPESIPSTRKNNDWGILFNLKGHIPIKYPWAIALDVRYQLGMQDQTINSTDSYKSRNLQTLAGISFFF